MGGGMTVVQEGRITGQLALPLGGVVSDRSLAEVTREATEVREAFTQLGYRHRNPFMNVSTLGLLVSPEIRLSDRGLVDVRRRRLVSALADR
jgi:adenine deaminase